MLNESSLNVVSKLENLVDSPIKDVDMIIQSSPSFFSKDFQISNKEVFEELHVVPSENLFLDLNDIDSTNTESLYPKCSHKISCSLNDKKSSSLGNFCLTSKQENTNFLPSSGLSKRSISKETLDYIITELMSTQGPAAIDCDASSVVKRRITFDHLENSVVPDMKGIQSESLLKGMLLKYLLVFIYHFRLCASLFHIFVINFVFLLVHMEKKAKIVPEVSFRYNLQKIDNI